MTFVCRKYPVKIMKHLQEDYRYGLEEIFWLRNLTNDLKENAEAERIITEYEKYNHSKLHKSMMDIIVRANEEKLKEVRTGMCDALVELMADIIEEKVKEKEEQARSVGLMEGRTEGRAEGRVEGHLEKLREQIQKKLTKGKSVTQIADELEEAEEKIRELLSSMKIG